MRHDQEPRNNIPFENLQAQNYTIRSIPASSLQGDNLASLGLIQLIKEGYGPLENEQQLQEEAHIQYFGDDDSRKVYVAEQNGKAISSLTIDLLKANETGTLGELFWKNLEKLSPALYTRAYTSSINAAFVWGMVTLPEARRRGIAGNLLRMSQKDLSPSIYLGQTNQPAVVQARVLAFGNEYRTFFGGSEVTVSNPQAQTSIHMPIVNAFLEATGNHLEAFQGFYIENDPTLPSQNLLTISGFPNSIQQAFQGVIQGQEKADQTQTSLGIVVSVKSEILE